MVQTRTAPLPELARHCARWLARALRDVVDADAAADSANAGPAGHPYAILALPGGRSVARPLELLLAEEVDWRTVEVVFADERHLPQGDPNRNDAAVAQFTAGIAARGHPAGQLHSVPFVAGRPEEAARRYRATVNRLGGRIDVILLGAGEDGHVASLFPGRRELQLEGPGVTAVSDAPKPPPERVSMTPGLIRTARRACLLFIGEGKREAYARFCDPSVPLTECPAGIVRAIPEVLVLADSEAAGS